MGINQGVIAPPELQAAVSKMFARDGVEKTVEFFGISREAIFRLVGGLPVRAGTVSLVKTRMTEGRVSKVEKGR